MASEKFSANVEIDRLTWNSIDAIDFEIFSLTRLVTSEIHERLSDVRRKLKEA